jgi:hypothetical protein
MCGSEKTDTTTMFLSYEAYAQVISLLHRTKSGPASVAAEEKDRAIHVCIECLQEAYQCSSK